MRISPRFFCVLQLLSHKSFWLEMKGLLSRYLKSVLTHFHSSSNVCEMRLCFYYFFGPVNFISSNLAFVWYLMISELRFSLDIFLLFRWTWERAWKVSLWVLKFYCHVRVWVFRGSTEGCIEVERGFIDEMTGGFIAGANDWMMEELRQSLKGSWS